MLPKSIISTSKVIYAAEVPRVGSDPMQVVVDRHLYVLIACLQLVPSV